MFVPFRTLSQRVFLLAAISITPAAVTSQTAGWEAGQLLLTRPQLQELLTGFEKAGSSSEWSSEFKIRMKSEAELVRRRLTEGDFQVGDQITLTVEGEFDNKPLTLVVGPSRVVPIAGMRELSLAGVLRSELNEKMREHIAIFIKNPVIRTEPLIRLSVMGQVGRPSVGLLLPAQSLIAELITQSGGPTPTSDLPKAYITRGNDKIWEGEAFQAAIAQGRTLDQMQLRSGDQLMIPMVAERSASLMRFMAIVPAAILAITGLLAIF